MFNFLSSIFNHAFWLVIIVILGIIMCLTGLVQCVSDDYHDDRISISLMLGNTDAAAERMHERFMDVCAGDTNHVSTKRGAQAEKVIRECLEADDVESACKVFSDYKHGLSAFERPRLYKYMVEHNLPNAEDYK